mgnify:FL=1
MSMRKRAALVLACALALPAALACGPDFPQNLLDDRKGSLLDMPEGTFAFEAAHLLPKPDDQLSVVEDDGSENPVELRVKAEARGLSAAEFGKVEAMRPASGPTTAAIAGKGLAPELFEYALGAIAFGAGDRDAASGHFRRVIALSPPDRSRRGLWALCMLGRTEAAGGNTDGAIAAFGQVRKHAASGEPDPLGLAVASLGEQARVHWHHGNIAAAVALYAQQAAHGSASGNASLLFVARALLAHPDLLDKALDDPLTQRLLAAYLYTRSNEFSQDWPLAGTGPASDDSGDDANAGRSSTAIGVEGFLAAVQKHGIDHFDGADRMAAGAYQAGRYALAGQLAARSTTPMAAWVRAKLALRAGDQATAMREYAVAAKGFPIDERWGEDDSETGAVRSPVCRVESERGVLALGRGE